MSEIITKKYNFAKADREKSKEVIVPIKSENARKQNPQNKQNPEQIIKQEVIKEVIKEPNKTVIDNFENLALELKYALKNKKDIAIVCFDGTTYTGKIVGLDKYTIKVSDNPNDPDSGTWIYKHAQKSVKIFGN